MYLYSNNKDNDCDCDSDNDTDTDTDTDTDNDNDNDNDSDSENDNDNDIPEGEERRTTFVLDTAQDHENKLFLGWWWSVQHPLKARMQMDPTLLVNNTQHCWARHIASDCMEPQQCSQLLRIVWNRSNFWLNKSQYSYFSVIGEA